jgi:hypothetical protein
VLILVMLFIPQGLVGWIAERDWSAWRKGSRPNPAKDA